MPSTPSAPQGCLPHQLWRSRDGATAIEMAFLLPVFLLFLLGIEEFGGSTEHQASAPSRDPGAPPDNSALVPGHSWVILSS